MNVNFRGADQNDAQALALLDAICFSVPWPLAAFEQEFSGEHNAFYIVAEAEGEIIAYCGLWAILDEGHITNVAVHPAYRRQGLASMLVKALMTASLELGLIRFTLEVRESNAGAIALYEGLGFKQAGRRKGYYADNKEDALILWCERDPWA